MRPTGRLFEQRTTLGKSDKLTNNNELWKQTSLTNTNLVRRLEQQTPMAFTLSMMGRRSRTKPSLTEHTKPRNYQGGHNKKNSMGSIWVHNWGGRLAGRFIRINVDNARPTLRLKGGYCIPRIAGVGQSSADVYPRPTAPRKSCGDRSPWRF